MKRTEYRCIYLDIESSVAAEFILDPLNTGSPSISPSFHNIQAIQHPKPHELSKPRKIGQRQKTLPNTNQYHNFSHLNTPVTFSSFQFVNRWIDSKILLEVSST